jgi:hypothetical protein
MNPRDQLESWTERLAGTAEQRENFFGPGEWLNEPDEVKFIYKGVPCRIARNPVGSLCGYISVNSDHPWFKVHYDDIDCEVHGGLTYGEANNELWEVGFDCAHARDISPAVERSLEKGREELKERYPDLAERIYTGVEWMRPVYRSIDFVVNECISLADQAIEALNAVG